METELELVNNIEVPIAIPVSSEKGTNTESVVCYKSPAELNHLNMCTNEKQFHILYYSGLYINYIHLIKATFP